jgi:trimeric autotransporter adhesin
MNKKKVTCSALAALMIAGTTSFPALAAMPKGTVVIGEKAFALDYANEAENKTEMMEQIKAIQTTEGKIFVKAPNGVWFNNDQSKLEDASVIPAVTYKDAEGEKNFEKGDGDETGQGEFKVVDISALGEKTIKVNFNKPVEDTGKLDLKIKRETTTVKFKEDKTVWNENKTSVTLTANYNLQDGDYVAIAKYDGGEETKTEAVKIEEAKMTNIKFTNEHAILGTKTVEEDGSKKNKQTLSFYVKFTNQYDEEVDVSESDITVNAPTNKWSYDDGKVILEFDNFLYKEGDTINVSVFHKNPAVLERAELEISPAIAVAELEAGEITTKNKDHKDKQVYVDSLQDLKDDDGQDGYYIPVVAKDQYGNLLSKEELNDETLFNVLVSDTNVISVGEFDKDDDGNLYLEIKAPDVDEDKERAGKVTVFITSLSPNSTARKVEAEIEVLADSEIDKINISKPENTVKAGAEFVLPFEAIDQYGKEVKSEKDLNPKEDGSDKIEFSEDSYIEVTNGTIISDIDADDNVIIKITPDSDTDNITVNAKGKNRFNTLNIKVEDAAVPKEINKFSSHLKMYIENGVTTTVKASRFLLHDQYSDSIDLPTGYKFKLTIDDTSKIAVYDEDGENPYTGDKLDGNVLTIDGSNKYTFKGIANGNSKIDVELQDENDKKIDSKEFTMHVIDLEDIDKFAIELDDDRDLLYVGDKDVDKDDYALGFEIVGKKGDKTVEIRQETNITAVTITSDDIDITTGGAITLINDIDTSGKEKEIEFTVFDKDGHPLKQTIKISDAKPQVKEVTFYDGDGEKTDGPVKIDLALLAAGKDMLSDDMEDCADFYMEDQYGVEMEGTFIATEFSEGASVKFNGTKVATSTLKAGDKFTLRYFAKNGVSKKIKVIVK